jgi:prevent-host-death family protein
MVKRYSIQEAQGHFPGIVEEVEGGARIELTREGRPVALLLRLPVETQPAAPDRPGDFWAAYEEFRRTHDLTSDPIDPDEIFVRDKSPDRDFSL